MIYTSQSCFVLAITSSLSKKNERSLVKHKNSRQEYTTRFSWLKLAVKEWLQLALGHRCSIKQSGKQFQCTFTWCSVVAVNVFGSVPYMSLYMFMQHQPLVLPENFK